MTGIYLECEWCGNVEKIALNRKFKQFRKAMNKWGWIYIKNGKGSESDFCSDKCYQLWKLNQHGI